MIIDTADADLEVNAKKLKTLFRDDIVHASREGTCSLKLWTVCRAIASQLKGDTHLNEGYNSIIRTLSERSKNIGLPLLSARCNIKKALGVGSRNASKSWDSIAAPALSILNECCEHSDDQSIFTEDRWATPKPIRGLPERTAEVKRVMKMVRPNLNLTQSWLWASVQAVLWNKFCKQPDSRVAFAIVPAGLTPYDCSLHFCAEKYYSLASTVKVEFEPLSIRFQVGDDHCRVVRVPNPLSEQYSTNMTLLQNHYDNVHMMAVDGSHPNRFSLWSVVLKWHYNSDLRVFATVHDPKELFTLKPMKPRAPNTKKRKAKDFSDRGDDDHDALDDGDDEPAHEGPPAETHTHTTRTYACCILQHCPDRIYLGNAEIEY